MVCSGDRGPLIRELVPKESARPGEWNWPGWEVVDAFGRTSSKFTRLKDAEYALEIERVRVQIARINATPCPVRSALWDTLKETCL